MARHAGRWAPYWAARYLIGCVQRWTRYIRGRLLIHGINIEALGDVANLCDVVLVVVIDMMQSGLISPVEDKPIKEPPPVKTFLPLDRFLEDIGRGPFGIGINRETWGQDVSNEPPMPEQVRSPTPEG